MKIRKPILGLIIVFSAVIGCVGEGPTGVAALEFRLVAVDGDGREKSVFEQGERIGLRVKAINHSRDELELSTQLGCWVYQFDQLMEVYSCSDVASNPLDPIGRAFLYPINCLGLGLSVSLPGRGEEIVTTRFWDENPENELLRPGKYCSFVKGEGIINRVPVSVDMEVSFEVR